LRVRVESAASRACISGVRKGQLQAQVADLGEQAVQGRLVGDRPGDGGLAAVVAIRRPSNQADQRLSRTPLTRIS